MKKFLRMFLTCLCLFFAIDSVLYIAFGFRCIDILLHLLGVETGINGVPKWIVILVCVAVIIFRVEYDAILDYSFRSEDRRKHN